MGKKLLLQSTPVPGRIKSTSKIVASRKSLRKHFPVVGFGGSAGGIEAFSVLLKHLDPDLGLAYVFILHLSPKHKSSLAKILQTKTKMPVHTARDAMKVKPNNIYVIPPNALMSLVDGQLKLESFNVKARGNFAVDYFLNTLATAYKNNSIGVILSGTATDGTLGLKAIKAEGGITFAQDESAKFSGMPRNAYDSGYADFILSPQDIATELSQLAKVPYTVVPASKIEEDHKKGLRADTESLKKILLLIREKTGVDFFLNYKKASVYRRVVRRMVLNKCKTLEDYRLTLSKNDKEIFELYGDFLINVTDFFRDAEFYQALNDNIFPSIVKQRKTSDPIRIWVAGCSTGEEAYSVAISLREFLATENREVDFQIFASDLDSHAIERARAGMYPASALLNVPEKYLKKYFKKINGHFQVEKSIREVCIFSHQNLLKDPPFSRMDLISCQNVLIYLEAPAQQRILQTFHYAMKASGFLFLGKSESIGDASMLFDSLDKRVKIYSRRNHQIPVKPAGLALPVLTSVPRIGLRAATALDGEISKVLLTRFVYPTVVLNETFHIVQFFGVVASYLNPMVGKASLNVLKMIREDLLIDLRSLLNEAKKSGKAAVKASIPIIKEKRRHLLNIEVIPKKVDNEMLYMVVFIEKEILRTSDKRTRSRTKDQKDKAITTLEDELLKSREVIRTTNEEYETTYEELQAYNEEVLSSNEELQSVNEELETSREELQSVNEELTTINEELQKRNLDLREAQDYAKAIVDTVNSPFLVLTSNLQVKSANKSFYETFKLEPVQANGSFIYEIGEHSLDIPTFRENINLLLEKKTDFVEFKLNSFFPGKGEMVFYVSGYRLKKEGPSSETLILLAFINLSDLLKANIELRNINEHLEEFIFVASHDLQEPLRKIQVFSNALVGHDGQDVYTKQFIEKINTTAGRMSTLLKDLLSYSTLLRRQDKNFGPLDLNLVLKDVMKYLAASIDANKATVNIEPLPVINGDYVQIHQLFSNLIMNALKFNTSTPPTISIFMEEVTENSKREHGLNQERKYASISVKDNGIGFEQKYAEKIFVILQRLSPGAKPFGTGMGLTVCKKIVEHHDGVVFARSMPAQGSTFTILFPVAEVTAMA